MNIGLVIAGGVGARMNNTTPKQFIAVKGKPIIIYTLEAFQKNSSIDYIAVVCLKGWEDILRKYAQQYNITKLKWITPGGSTGMESLRNGMNLLRENCSEDDIIIIHDAVRPLLSDDIINANIAGVVEFGTVATCTLLVELGETVHFVLGQSSNFKITTAEDIGLLEAYLTQREKKSK